MVRIKFKFLAKVFILCVFMLYALPILFQISYKEPVNDSNNLKTEINNVI
jgi:hypothetical protein